MRSKYSYCACLITICPSSLYILLKSKNLQYSAQIESFTWQTNTITRTIWIIYSSENLFLFCLLHFYCVLLIVFLFLTSVLILLCAYHSQSIDSLVHTRVPVCAYYILLLCVCLWVFSFCLISVNCMIHVNFVAREKCLNAH